MRFIFLDGILVDFDCERCQAALSVLARLTQRTQGIILAHHSRVVEQARKLGGKQQVYVHDR